MSPIRSKAHEDVSTKEYSQKIFSIGITHPTCQGYWWWLPKCFFEEGKTETAYWSVVSADQNTELEGLFDGPIPPPPHFTNSSPKETKTPKDTEGHPAPALEQIFPFEYQGGGYFRRKGVPVGKTADILHGEQVIAFLYERMSQHLDLKENKGEKPNEP